MVAVVVMLTSTRYIGTIARNWSHSALGSEPNGPTNATSPHLDRPRLKQNRRGRFD
jgi:hypothetical protein